MSKRRNRQRRESQRELAAVMQPVAITDNSLTLETLPERYRLTCLRLAEIMTADGADAEDATDAAFLYLTWAVRTMGLWPAVVDEAHGVRV